MTDPLAEALEEIVAEIETTQRDLPMLKRTCYAIAKQALADHEAEKELFRKTQEWHSHGAVAPSCVGCPTSEADTGDYIRVSRQRVKDVVEFLLSKEGSGLALAESVFFPKTAVAVNDAVVALMAYLTGADDA